jgi:hypothetical protein
MAKANAEIVNSTLAKQAVEKAKTRQGTYSECIVLSYRMTGKFAPGFDNKDLQAWIDLYMPHVFDEKGNKINLVSE